MSIEELRGAWSALATKFIDSPTVVNALWSELEVAYNQKDRHYHNLAHISYMVDRAMVYKANLIDDDTVLFSIFYHDFVYRATRSDNELKSAGIAQDRLEKLGVPDDKIEACKRQIMATKHHETQGDNDTDYLIDFDLAILGDTPERYNAYTKQIRAEYSIYPDFLYNPGRKKVLRHFLEMKQIYKTAAFCDAYEKQARENLAGELQRLS